MAERQLWQSVLFRAYDDARGRKVPGESREEREAARRDVSGWVWTQDFCLVCVLAGVAVNNARRSMLKALARGGNVFRHGSAEG